MIQMMINISDGRDDADSQIRMVQMIHTNLRLIPWMYKKWCDDDDGNFVDDNIEDEIENDINDDDNNNNIYCSTQSYYNYHL